MLDDLPPLREVIREFGLDAKKSLGQNFLLDLNVTQKVARQAGRLEGALVVEGLGGERVDGVGGALEGEAAGLDAAHVEQVGEELGDLVDGWIPMVEPARWALQGWLTAAGPPGRVDDAEGFSGALQGALLGSVEAALRLRAAGRPVATGQWVVPAFPARVTPDVPPSPEAEAMVGVVDEALFGCWRRLLLEGTLVVPGRAPIEIPDARVAFDRIGFTYRHAVAVRGDGALLPFPQQLPVRADGQVSWAEGLALALHHVADTFGDRPIQLVGYGVASDDPAFDEFEHQARTIVQGAIDDGIDLRSAWWDAPLDVDRPPARPTSR